MKTYNETLSTGLAVVLITSVTYSVTFEPKQFMLSCLALLLFLAVVFAASGTIVLLDEARRRMEKDN